MKLTTATMTRKEALLAELAADVSDAPKRLPPAPSDYCLARFRELGTQLWLDTGNLDEAATLWRAEMSALTTNNTLANQVVQTGLMDDVIRLTARRVKDIEPDISDEDFVMDIAFVVNCHIAQRLVHAFDALVSVELHPSLSHDIERTFRYAQRYYAVNPDRFIVKIPLSPEGYCAVARARADGIPINYTLGFSARQNYLATLLSGPNYVNVFLGRLNQVVADNGLGDGKNVGERTALASQIAVRQIRDSNPHVVTHQIAASMRNAEQMLALAGMDVYTVPPKAVAEFFKQEHKPGDITSRLAEDYPVTIADSKSHEAINVLWTVDAAFRAFAQQLADRDGTKLTGDDLRAADRDCGTRLFANFTADEQAAIRSKGKIPETSRWIGRASLDDLMTESAVQSFTTDQAALDGRIRTVAASG